MIRAPKPFMLIHSDVWGPSPEFNNHGFRNYVSFINDFTRMSWIYFLKTKSEILDTFCSFYKMIQTEFQTQIRIFRSENEGGV